MTASSGEAVEQYRQVPVPSGLVGAFIGTAGAAIRELVGQVGMPVRVRPAPDTSENQMAIIWPCPKSGDKSAILDRAEQAVRTKIDQLRRAPWGSWTVPVGGLSAPERTRSPQHRRDNCSWGELGSCRPPKGCRPPRTPPEELSVLNSEERFDPECNPWVTQWGNGDEAWDDRTSGGFVFTGYREGNAWDDEDEDLEWVVDPEHSNWHGLDDLEWEAAVAAAGGYEDNWGDGEWPDADGEWPDDDGEWPNDEEGGEEEEEDHEDGGGGDGGGDDEGDEGEDDPNDDQEEEGGNDGDEEEEEEYDEEQEEEYDEEQEEEEEYDNEYEGYEEEVDLWRCKEECNEEWETQEQQQPQQAAGSGSRSSSGSSGTRDLHYFGPSTTRGSSSAVSNRQSACLRHRLPRRPETGKEVSHAEAAHGAEEAGNHVGEPAQD